MTVAEAHDGDAEPSMDARLAPFEALLSVPPFTIFKVFKQLYATSLSFESIPQERTVAFPAACWPGFRPHHLLGLR